MPMKHVVRGGEHMAFIAAHHGFQSYRTVWDHPDNAPLRATRSPHVLAPGDEVMVPDLEVRTADAATERRHRFFVKRARIGLRLCVQRPDASPIAQVSCDVDLDGAPERATTDEDGILSVRISDTAEIGTLTIGENPVTVRIGHLDPVDLISGWQGRLMNLGYYSGVVGQADDPRSQIAVEEFQLDNGLQVTGVVDGATRSALLAAHGC